jgi:NAD(P)-dependent dehydrogenase (short-subunit alcohol dehydrogenase family)
VYRGSKAALNTFMRSYAARHAGGHRTLVLMAPGWVRTGLGGPDARLSIDDSIPNVVKTLDALRGSPGLHYVDYLGRTVAWRTRHRREPGAAPRAPVPGADRAA